MWRILLDVIFEFVPLRAFRYITLRDTSLILTQCVFLYFQNTRPIYTNTIHIQYTPCKVCRHSLHMQKLYPFTYTICDRQYIYYTRGFAAHSVRCFFVFAVRIFPVHYFWLYRELGITVRFLLFSVVTWKNGKVCFETHDQPETEAYNITVVCFTHCNDVKAKRKTLCMCIVSYS